MCAQGAVIGNSVLSWAAIQVADVVLPAPGTRPWVTTLTIAFAMIGFPVALAAAWLYEVTPAGLLRDNRRVPYALSGKQKIVDVVIMGCLALVVGYFSIGVLSDVRRARETGIVESSQTRVTAARNTIAVLPFSYIGANLENAYIGDGIAEEILRLLSRINELRLTARTASFYFKDKPNVDVQTIATKLQVRHLLTGSIQVAGDAIRINAELVDATAGEQLWSESFNRQMIDTFDIQSEIAKAVADDAESDCQAALEIDDSLPEVHTALGDLYRKTGEFEKSGQEFRAAISTSPNFYEAYSGLGDVLTSKGELDGAESAYMNLIQLQPAYWRGYQKLGVYYYRLGRDPDALPNFIRVTDLTPDNAPGWNNLGSVQYMLGDLEGAASAWKRAIDFEPAASMHLNLGTMYYYLGRYEDAVEMQRGGVEISPDDYRRLKVLIQEPASTI